MKWQGYILQLDSLLCPFLLLFIAKKKETSNDIIAGDGRVKFILKKILSVFDRSFLIIPHYLSAFCMIKFLFFEKGNGQMC